jgi:hypothetical protein
MKAHYCTECEHCEHRVPVIPSSGGNIVGTA